MSQIRLGDLLIRAGVVSDAQLNTALAEQKQWGGRLGTILVRMGALSEDLLVKALSRQLGLPRAALGPNDPIVVPDGVLARIDRATCERLLVVPVGYVKERRTVHMAIADPFNIVAIDDLSRRLGVRVETLLAGETQIMQAIVRVYSGAPQVGQPTENIGFIDNSGRTIGQSPVVVPPPQQPPQWAPVTTQPPQQPLPQWAPATTQPPQQQPPQWAPATQPPQPAWTSPPAPAATWSAVPAQHSTSWPTFTASFAPPPNPGAGPTSAAPGPPDDLRVVADQQLRAVRALVELLIDKGVVSRAELSAWLARGA
jgi:hypothetical protein